MGLNRKTNLKRDLKMTEVTRRKFMNMVGIGALTLLTSPTKLFARKPLKSAYLNIFPFHRDEYHSLISPRIPKPTVRIGDRIRFIPEIDFHGFSETDNNDLYFEHVILNVYEFSFVPRVKLSTKSDHLIFVDFLIETPKFILSFSTLDPEKQYLKVGQWYRGYGTLRNYLGDPFRFYPSVDKRKIENLKVNAKVENILDYDISHTWHENKETRIHSSMPGVYKKSIDRDAPDYKYFNDFEEFKKLVAPYQDRFKEIQSSKACLLPTYRLSIFWGKKPF